MNFYFHKSIRILIFTVLVIFLNACSTTKKISSTSNTHTTPPKQEQNSNKTNVDGLLWYAKKQLGTPYKYGASDPKNGGFDCSGFMYYVYTHFNIKVPRTSYDYMSYGKEVSKQQAQKGDVILFTGSDANTKKAGHVGIITENKGGDISFIHASTSKGVIINKLSDSYYIKRFLKIVHILP